MFLCDHVCFLCAHVCVLCVVMCVFVVFSSLYQCGFVSLEEFKMFFFLRLLLRGGLFLSECAFLI